MKSGRYRGAFTAFLIFGLFGALVTVIWRGSILLAQGEMVSGDLFAFVLYSGFIGGTIGGMASVFTRIQKFLGATEDLFAIFEEKEEGLHDVSNSPAIHSLHGAIRFEKVSFAYPNRPDVDVLNAIDLAIAPNQMVALVGASGAGKSTITALLLRLHDAQKGIIRFDDVPNHEIPLSELRSQIALVPQDIFLFGGSIRENIAYGNPNASEKEILQAAENANALEFIERFAEGMETVVGERGTQLSGGQRQRIAIARALLKNPKILILDEATSALDSKSEQLVQEALKRLMNNRTTIVIAHRLSTIKNADVIFVLENGQLVESGTHEQLMLEQKGIYQKLSRLQKMDNE